MWTFAAKEGLGDLMSVCVVGFWDYFRDHENRIFSRPRKERTTGTAEEKNWKLVPGNCSYTGTATFSTISRSTWSACSDFFRVEAYRPLTTTRWAKTGTASGLKSSGVQKVRPSRKAMACAAR